MTSGYITQGKIVRVVSIYGTYEILTTSKKRMIQAIAVRETSSHLHGVKSSHYYLPGTSVVVFVPDHFETGGEVGLILGAANDVPIIDTDGGDDKGQGKNPYKMLAMLDNSMTHTLERNDASLKYSPKDTALENDYSYGMSADILPGEWSKTTYLGGGFFLSDFLMALRISEAAKIEGVFFKDLLRLTAKAYQERTAANEKTEFIEGVLNSAIVRRAATMLESMGSINGDSPVLPNKPTEENPYLYKYKKQCAYYAHQIVSDFLPQGELDTITLPPAGDVEMERPPGVLSIYKGYDGSYNVKAIKEISLEKTSIIPVPWSPDEPDTILDEKDRSKYEPQPYYEKADIKETDASFFGAEAVRQIAEHNLEKDSFANFRTRDLVWSVPENKKEVLEDLKKVGADFTDDPEIKNLPVDEPYYSDPPVKKGKIKAVVDEEGKREKDVEVFDLSSFIKQTADGSIIISGGWGEEIRMYRGNIYLTCPGDIIKTPGRDSVLMAGGNNIQKANRGTTEIESETSTFITNGNMQLVAGVSDKGTLIIENKSKKGPDMDTYADNMGENKSVGGGILMKGIAVTALSNNIYLQGDNPDNSQITMKTGTISRVTKQAITYIQSGGQSLTVTPESMIRQAGSSIGMVAQDVIGFNTSYIKCHGGEVKIPFREFEKDKDSEKEVAPSSPSLVVQGSLQAGSMATDSISTTDGGMLGKNPTFLTKFNKIFRKPPPGTGAEKTESPLPLAKLALNDELERWGIRLPESRYSKLELPVSRWQNMIQDPEKWKAVEIDQGGKEKAMSYPGKYYFTKGKCLKKLGKEGSLEEEQLSEGLIINSK